MKGASEDSNPRLSGDAGLKDRVGPMDMHPQENIATSEPGAFAVAGINETSPQVMDDGAATDINNNSPMPPRRPSRTTTSAVMRSPPVQASLVREPPLVMAEPAPDESERRKQMMAERQKWRRQTAFGVVALLVLVAVGVTVAAVMAGRDDDGDDSNNPSSATSPQLTALCKTQPLEIHVSEDEDDCQLQSLAAELLDDGSTGNIQTRSVVPTGPYAVGSHVVSLVIEDEAGNRDFCSATIVVADPLTEWNISRNHAYRVRGCRTDWSDAASRTEQTALCGSAGHLATLSSEVERDLVRSLASSLELGGSSFWMGGFQPDSSFEPEGNWTWVNDEGLIFEGYTDWDEGEPNDGDDENCMVMLGNDRGFHWDDRECDKVYRYIEEVEVNATVMVNGCDSGVQDTLVDPTSCSLLISSGIVERCGGFETTNQFESCLNDYLTTLVDDGVLVRFEKEQILFCGSENTAPVAVCRDLNITTNASEPVAVVASDIFDGSSDPDGDLIRLEMKPTGPFRGGTHLVTLTVADTRGGVDTCQSTVTVDDGNLPPVARCKEMLKRSAGPSCNGRVEIVGPDLDDGSSDQNSDDSLFFTLTPSGPFPVGVHTVTLTVSDDQGASDSCETTIVIQTDIDQASFWTVFDSHAYRAQLCSITWASASQFASETTLCGAQAHLATITTEEERDAVRELVRRLGLGNKSFWLGGFQFSLAEEPSEFHWMDDESLVSDGFTDWDQGEPNNAGVNEDCIAMSGANRGYRWDDRTCTANHRYIEEVSLEANVTIDGCDSGVPDSLVDMTSCTYLIDDGISSCSADGAGDSFASCVDAFLSGLVDSGTLTTDQRDAIANCAGISRNGEGRNFLRG